MRTFIKIILFLFVIFIVFSLGIIALGFFLSPQDRLLPADAIVVISGGETYSRTSEGIKLYQKQYAPMLIFSGDALDPESISNAAAMKKIAIEEYDISLSAIITEEYSNSTYENALNLKPIFDQNHIRSIILVTSPYHQRRSKMTFQYVMGENFQIFNHSSTDDLWRKIAWWRNDRAIYLTTSELWKILYIYATGKYN
ncbi:MAG: YdcF family protein [Patescibacteria group bacterium]